MSGDLGNRICKNCGAGKISSAGNNCTYCEADLLQIWKDVLHQVPPGSYLTESNATQTCKEGLCIRKLRAFSLFKGKYASIPGGVNCFGYSPGNGRHGSNYQVQELSNWILSA